MATDFSCPICGEPCADGHERIDHLTDEHNAITKLAEGEYHQ